MAKIKAKKRKKQQPNSAIFILPFSILGLVLALVIISNSTTGTFTASAEQLEEGKQVYSAKCASCHGTNGEGKPASDPNNPNGLAGAPPHDPTGHTWHHPDSFLFDRVKNGSSIPGSQSMPAFKDELTDDQIRFVLAYIKTFWTPQQRIAQATASAR